MQGTDPFKNMDCDDEVGLLEDDERGPVLAKGSSPYLVDFCQLGLLEVVKCCNHLDCRVYPIKKVALEAEV